MSIAPCRTKGVYAKAMLMRWARGLSESFRSSHRNGSGANIAVARYLEIVMVWLNQDLIESHSIVSLTNKS